MERGRKGVQTGLTEGGEVRAGERRFLSFFCRQRKRYGSSRRQGGVLGGCRDGGDGAIEARGSGMGEGGGEDSTYWNSFAPGKV